MLTDVTEPVILGEDTCLTYLNMGGSGPVCGAPSDVILWAGCIHEHLQGMKACKTHALAITRYEGSVLVCSHCKAVPRPVPRTALIAAGFAVYDEPEWQWQLGNAGPHYCKLRTKIEER